MTTPDIEALARRECTICDPEHEWVIACAHFDGGEVTLRWYDHPTYVEFYAYEPDPNDPDELPWRSYGVWGALSPTGPYFDGGETNDRNEAFAAFERGQVWLLRGDGNAPRSRDKGGSKV